MTSEWPQSVQNVAHSIQNSNPEPDLNQNEERAPLLHDDRESTCLRNVWITFFVLFLCVGLATGGYLLLTEELEWPIVPQNYSLITRSDWRAHKVSSKMPKLEVPIKRVLLTKTNSPECRAESECSREIHKVQSDHLNRLQEPDIAYNFLIAGDGQTYEGRGWNYQAMISSSNDNRTLVVAFLGVFNNSEPSKKQISQVKSFLEVSENRGKLSTCYSIEGEQNANQTQGFLTSVISYFQRYYERSHKHC